MYHNPVLLHESIAGLAIRPDGIYVDVTFGGGGHSREILKHLESGRLITFDQDEDAIRNAPDDERFLLINANFRFMYNFLKFYKAFPVDGILADLGISSHQIDAGERGFSTRYDAELDMRMDRRNKKTGRQVINNYSENELINIFRQYGEIKNARQLAKTIVQERKTQEIKSTAELMKIAARLAPRKQENKYAAMLFQAVRIEVNNELDALKTLLMHAYKSLREGGRMVVISYHSLEDRLVKNFFKTGNFEGQLKKDFFGNPELKFKMISKKPIRPSEQEIKENPRARSAKLRIAEKS